MFPFPVIAVYTNNNKTTALGFKLVSLTCINFVIHVTLKAWDLKKINFKNLAERVGKLHNVKRIFEKNYNI